MADFTGGIRSYTLQSVSAGINTTMAVEQSATVKLSGYDREPNVGLTGIAGKKATPVAGYIETTFFIASDLSLGKLANAEDIILSVHARNGKVYGCSEGYLETSPELDLAAGTVPLKVIGRVEEVTA